MPIEASSQALSSHQRILGSINASHFPQPPSRSSHKPAQVVPKEEASRKYEQVSTSAHAPGVNQSTKSSEANNALDNPEDIAQQIQAAIDTPQDTTKEQSPSTTSQMENIVPPVPAPKPAEPIDIPGARTPVTPTSTHYQPLFIRRISPPTVVPVFPPGLMPMANNAASTSTSVPPVSTLATIKEPQMPLKTAEEVEAFAKARAHDCNLPQVPTEPPEHEWTVAEIVWHEQLMRRSKSILRKMAKREQERLKAEEGLKKALGGLALNEVDSGDKTDDDQEWVLEGSAF